MKFKEFKSNVIKWALERKIIPNSSFNAQYIKLIEELGELALGIRKKDERLIKDSIGDVAVVLINLAGIEKIDTQIELIDYNVETDNWFNYLSYIIGMIAFSEEAVKSVKIEDIEQALFYLKKISEQLRFNFMECCELAWNEIKDRKGYLREDGIFVKEEDIKK